MDETKARESARSLFHGTGSSHSLGKLTCCNESHQVSHSHACAPPSNDLPSVFLALLTMCTSAALPRFTFEPDRVGSVGQGPAVCHKLGRCAVRKAKANQTAPKCSARTCPRLTIAHNRRTCVHRLFPTNATDTTTSLGHQPITATQHHHGIPRVAPNLSCTVMLTVAPYGASHTGKGGRP